MKGSALRSSRTHRVEKLVRSREEESFCCRTMASFAASGVMSVEFRDSEICIARRAAPDLWLLFLWFNFPSQKLCYNNRLHSTFGLVNVATTY